MDPAQNFHPNPQIRRMRQGMHEEPSAGGDPDHDGDVHGGAHTVVIHHDKMSGKAHTVSHHEDGHAEHKEHADLEQAHDHSMSAFGEGEGHGEEPAADEECPECGGEGCADCGGTGKRSKSEGAMHNA